MVSFQRLQAIPNELMERKLVTSLPSLAYMVSRPEQNSELGERTRCQSVMLQLGLSWLRDLQHDLEVHQGCGLQSVV